MGVQCAVAGATTPAAASIRRWARAARLGSGRRVRAETVVVRIVGRSESARLNAGYRAKAGPTNVLSFGYDGPAAAKLRPHLGDLVICAPVVRAEARAQGKSERAHWAHMVVHGIMHLCGYDHQSAPEARRMERRERRILAGLGFPDPYLLPPERSQ